MKPAWLVAASCVGVGVAFACSTVPGTTIIVENQPPPSATATTDASAPSGPTKLDLDAGDTPADAGGVDTQDSSTLSAACSRDFNYDAYCADPDAGFGSGQPYGYECDAGSFPGNDCSTKSSHIWCCAGH